MASNDNWKLLGRIAGVSVLTVGLNLVIAKLVLQSNKDETIEDLKDQIKGQQFRLDKSRKRRNSRKFELESPTELKKWGSIKVLPSDKSDTLLEELKEMTLLSCEIVKVSNLFIDLELINYKFVPCPIVCHGIKRTKDEPFLMEDALLQPGAFVIRNCVFKAGQTIEYERKFLRAGPRATQFFKAGEVRADIVSLGDICPGINTVIRELTLLLRQVYKVDKVTGIKHSFEGYYSNSMIELTPKLVETIHHFGGCYLGTCRSQFFPDKIIDSLVERGVNQLYLIGAYHTLVSARELYQQIKKRKLKIALCIVVKAYNKNLPIFDNCFGFESAIEETQRFVEAGFVAASSYQNCVTMVKVPGDNTGFLAMDACRSARNVNVCLVPEFAYDIYGEKGLLKYIISRVQHRGSCKILYSEGAALSARDMNLETANLCRQEIASNPCANRFGLLLKGQIQKGLQKLKLNPHKVLLFDAIETVKAVPANSLDTKLCCQLAHASVQGLMCGYTNFVAGHLGLRAAWVPVPEMLSERYAISLQPQDENWQRLLAMTGQPSLINDEDEFVQSD